MAEGKSMGLRGASLRIVITGTSSGIGRFLTTHLGSSGNAVCGLARSRQTEMELASRGEGVVVCWVVGRDTKKGKPPPRGGGGVFLFFPIAVTCLIGSRFWKRAAK